MSKTVTSYTSQLVQFTTPLSFQGVASRLEQEVNKESSGKIKERLAATSIKTEVELEAVVKSITGDRSFLYFSEIPFDKLLQRFDGGKPQPRFTIYTVGNPVIAQGILKRNRLTGYHIPPRLVVTENEDGSGTTVSYHLPSSAMAVKGDPNDETLKEILKDLDARLEELVEKITRTKL